MDFIRVAIFSFVHFWSYMHDLMLGTEFLVYSLFVLGENGVFLLEFLV